MSTAIFGMMALFLTCVILAVMVYRQYRIMDCYKRAYDRAMVQLHDYALQNKNLKQEADEYKRLIGNAIQQTRDERGRFIKRKGKK